MDTLIQGAGITKRYGDFALDAFNITVEPDRVVGLIGSNGAGKTTLLKTLLGMTAPDTGTIRLLGADPHAHGALDTLKQRIGVVLDTCAFPVTMKVRDVETLGRAAYEKWDRAQFTELCTTFGLAPKKLVKDLSRGMGMKLSLAFALSHDPDLLILDEATAGLDPIARDEVLDIIRAFMLEEGRGVLMATHITTDLEKIADEVICIDDGALAFALPKEAICDEAGIAHCRTTELEAIKASDFAKDNQPANAKRANGQPANDAAHTPSAPANAQAISSVPTSAMMSFTSCKDAVVAFRRYNVLWVFSAMMLATVVLPVPEGP